MSRKWTTKSYKMEKSILILLISAVTVTLADNTPVLIWSPSRPLSDLPQSYTGQTLKTDSFHSNYLLPLTSEPSSNLVVFVQDKLSVEDFTNHADVYNPNSDGGAFKNIKAAMDDQFSVHLPSVTSPKAAIDALTESFAGKVVRVDNPDDVGSLQLEDGQSYLIIVSLSPVSGKNEAKAFQENDEAMGKCMHHLNKRGVKYSAIYTAQSSSKVKSEDNTAGRHLLASEGAEVEKIGTFYNTSYVIAYLRDINLTISKPDVKDSTKKMMFTINFSEVKMTAQDPVNDTFEFSIETLNDDNGTATLNMIVGLTPLGEWGVLNGTLHYDGKGAGDNFTFEDLPINYKIAATKGFCYHCTKLSPSPMMREYNNTEKIKVQLTLNGFQFQAFSPNVTMAKFTNNVWDCVEFFSVGIWMGILTAALLLMILFFGITMITNITTMDRFDDPKGKTITVTVNE